MKRSLKLLVVSLVMGLLVLATAVPAFAGGPPNPGDPTSHVSPAAHLISCDGQDPHTKPAFLASPDSFALMHELWHHECDDTGLADHDDQSHHDAGDFS